MGMGRTTKVRRTTAMPQQQPRAIIEFIIPSMTPGLTFSLPLHTERILDGRVADSGVCPAVGRRNIPLELVVLRG